MASNSPGKYAYHLTDFQSCEIISKMSGTLGSYGMSVTADFHDGPPFVLKDSGYNVSTSDGASTCSSSTTEPGELETASLLFLETKSLRSFSTTDEYLLAMKEDLADWFSTLYQNYEITAENFFQVLETGVLLCKHANKVQEFARQHREMGETLEMRSYFIHSVPESKVSYREGVKPETFQARDNVSNFITWTCQLGIPEVIRFESDDLVLRKNEKSVILCLLEVSRVGAKLGMLAPTLVQMEQEIDAELAGEEPQPWVQIKTCDMRSLDERVRDLIDRCTCPVQFPMVKVGDGKYKIGDTKNLIFVRILRNHVMVRVGGGWDTLENYLDKHDPCQCNYRGHRSGGASHKVALTHQRRSSNPNVASIRSTPKPQKQEHLGSASSRNSSSSPHTSRTSSPTFMISRNIPVHPKSGTRSNKPAVQASTLPDEIHEEDITQALLYPSPGNDSSSQPIRSQSSSPGRLRSSSPAISENILLSSPSLTCTNVSPLRGRDQGIKNKTTAFEDNLIGSLNRSAAQDDQCVQLSPTPTRLSSTNLDRESESKPLVSISEAVPQTTTSDLVGLPLFEGNSRTVCKGINRPDTDKQTRKGSPQFSSIEHTSAKRNSPSKSLSRNHDVPESTNTTAVKGRTLSKSKNTSNAEHQQHSLNTQTSNMGNKVRDPEHRNSKVHVPGEIPKSGLTKSQSETDNLRSCNSMPDPTFSEPEKYTPKPTAQTFTSRVRERPATASRIPKPIRPTTHCLLHNEVVNNCKDETEVSQRDSIIHFSTDLNNVSTLTFLRSSSNSSSINVPSEGAISPASDCRSLESMNSREDFYREPHTQQDIVMTDEENKAHKNLNIEHSQNSLTVSGHKTHALVGQRRQSMDTDKITLHNSVVFLQHTSDLSDPDNQTIIINDITFSDDEEIDNLIKNSALKEKVPKESKLTSPSVD